MRHSLAQPHSRTQQLIQFLESFRPTSEDRVQPNWAANLLEQVCEFIEPVQGEARVGYECRFVESLWQIELFLGKIEIVGGSYDGHTSYVNYTANVAGILGLFSSIRRCEWQALPCSQHPGTSTGLAIEGEWKGHIVRILLRMVPPKSVGVGLKHYQDGTYAIATA